MHFHKIASFSAALILMLSSCSNHGFVSQSDYDDLKKEYDELKESHEKTRDNYVNQANEMNEILNELSAITGRTNSLKLDIESGTAQITEADEIQGNIDEIKKKLDDLEKMASKDKANQKLIGSLRKTIEEKGRFFRRTRPSGSRGRPLRSRKAQSASRKRRSACKRSSCERKSPSKRRCCLKPARTSRLLRIPLLTCLGKRTSVRWTTGLWRCTIKLLHIILTPGMQATAKLRH